MKRRFFIITFIIGLFGVGVISLIQWVRGTTKEEELARPKFLSLLCDGTTLRMLGRAYLKLNPEETKNDILLNDLWPEKSGKLLLGEQDILAAESEIEKKIRQDFDTKKIVVVQGWVLSITEAKQCAVFSMINS